MAAFYWKDHTIKACPSDPKQKCVGPNCNAFCFLDDLYAYCGLTREPQRGELAYLPDGMKSNMPFPFHKHEGMERLIDLPHKNKDELEPR